MNKFAFLLVLLSFALTSCKKNSYTDSLSDVILKKEGLLRVECSNCEMNYHVQGKQYTAEIENGSNDLTFNYSGDFDLKTELVSKEDQKIRVVVIDSFGRIVSNELNDFSEGEVRVKTFNIVTR